MQADLRSLIEAALALPAAERAAIVTWLLDSLQDEEIDGDAEARWEAEVARRLDELDSARTGSSFVAPRIHDE